MRQRATILKTLGVIFLVAFYFLVLQSRRVEEVARSLQIHEEASTPDHVLVLTRIVSINPSAGEITARLDFQPAGKYAKDEVTPSINLKLLVNSVKGTQEIDFPQARRINPMEVVFPLEGNRNDYPFDHHDATLWMLLTAPGRAQEPPPRPAIKAKGEKRAPPRAAGELAVGSAVLERYQPVPIFVNLSASIEGSKFTGDTTRKAGQEATGIKLEVTRSSSVLVLSVIVMAMMIVLAGSVLVMTLHATSADRKLDLVPLSLAVSLIFGLPALRNIQPGIPAVGVFGDYISFLWAELVVAASAVIVVWTWIRRTRQRF
jgi:hypothetical protein